MLLVFIVTIFGFLVYAQDSVISNGIEEIKIDIIDPVEYKRDEMNFLDVNNKIVLYTPKWHYSSTKRSEETIDIEVKIENELHTVTKISDSGDSFIPLSGYIISVPKNKYNFSSFNIGDILTGEVLLKIEIYQHAIAGENGTRSPITHINEPPGINGFALLNSKFGKTTDLGQVFIEMVVDFDIDNMKYEVVSFKEPFSNDEAIIIPENGFVIATRNVSTMMQFIKDNKYKIGEEINLVELNLFEENEHTYIRNYIAINPTAQTNPNGASATAFRGADQMLIYTYEWKGKTSEGFTGANVHGYEVAVSNEGYIIGRGTNVKIPNGGMVISGHGVEATFLRDNANIGGKIKLNNSTNTFEITYPFFESKIVSMEIDLLESEKYIDNAKDMMFDVEITKAEDNYNKALNIFDNM